ncbi:L,D-transpeptidase family protein [Rhodoplanes azumiensis]|uniref:Murein L,D-transpeptidase n=1 Tax=Rhodoplanes azumiensis TaxID=1897628 RepID=A0ABW5AL64_9BRAD
MRFDRLLAGTALALVLALGTANAQSAPDTPAVAPAASAADAVPPTEPAPLAVTPADLAPADSTPAAVAPTPTPTPTPEPQPLAAATAPDAVRVEATAAPVTTPEVATPDTAAVPATAPAPVAVTPADVTPADTTAPKAATATPPAAEPATGSVPAAVAAPAGPTAPVVSLDQQVGEKLADLLSKKGDRRFDAKTRASLESFYAARANGPVWTSEGAVNARAKAVIAQLGQAEADGLDADDYPVPTLKADATADEVADYEMKLTQSVLAYAKHAAVGRIHWSRINGDVVYYQNPPEAAEVMGKLVSVKGEDAGAALDGYQPQHAHYKALKAKLAEARGLSSDTSKRIGYGPALKVGMDDARVPELREKLGVGGTGTAYDKTLAEAVKAFQKKKGLKQTGVFDAAAVDALNGPRNERTADVIRANLERWRWVPHDLGKAHVIVNIPEFVLRVYKDDAMLWTTRVVVGKPGNHATPLLSETMKYITVNPTWNVPPSIVYNEYLPALQQDPTVLSRMGLNVSRNRDGSIHISQPPGAGNALGRIRFNFPNKFLVYQHDTPDKHLFAHERRAYSHGCMRVKDPDKYAEVLLGITLPKEGYTAERIRRMYGTSETNINFPTPIPVHLTYQTASVDETGKLVLREDIYGRDQRLIAAMKSDERKVADQPTAERRVASSAPRRQAVQLPQEQPRSVFPLFNLFR